MLQAWYLRRAVPWGVLLGCMGPAAVLVLLVGRWESLAGLGLPMVALLSVAAAAFVFDDAAAAVTAVTPRGSRWARTARAVVAIVPPAVGLGLLAAAPAEVRGDRGDWVLVVAGLGASVLMLAVADGVRDVPLTGASIASVVVLAGLAPLVIGLFFDVRSPYPLPELSDGLRVAWATAGCIGLLGAVRLLLGRPFQGASAGRWRALR